MSSSTLIDEKVAKAKEVWATDAELLEAAGATDRELTLSDLIRMGESLGGQARAWADTEGNLCALSGAAVVALAHGLITED